MRRSILVPNLLGDGIYASFFVRRYIESHPGDAVEVWLPCPTWCMGLFYGIEGIAAVRVIEAGETADITVDLGAAFNLCHSKYSASKPFWHAISEHHGLNTEDMRVPPLKLVGRALPSQCGRVVLSPYSASCGSRRGYPANKMLSKQHWQAVFDLVHGMWQNGHCGKPLFIGGPGEQLLDDVLPEYELLDADFTRVVGVLQHAQVVIGVDTGTIRLANMLLTPTFYTTPVGLGKMFLPEWGGLTRHITGDPQSLPVQTLVSAVQRFLEFEVC